MNGFQSELKAGKVGRPRRPERSISEGIRHMTAERTIGRSPRSTNISSFYAGLGGREPGKWPSLLRRSWEERHGQTQPYPFGPDNMQSRGARASQYTS